MEEKYYTVSLKSGAAFVALHYYEMSSTTYRFEVVCNKGNFIYDTFKADIISIEDMEKEKVQEWMRDLRD